MDEYLSHEGVGHDDNPPGRGSGRYAWGSGELAFQRLKPEDLVTTINKLKREGMSEGDIALQLEITKIDKDGKVFGDTKSLREIKQIAVTESRAARRAKALEIYDKHMTKDGKVNISACAREMGLPNDTSFRSLIDDDIHNRKMILQKTIDQLEEAMTKTKYLDISKGTAAQLGVNENKFDTAIKAMELKGYNVYVIGEKQMGTGLQTNTRVLAPPDAKYSDVYNERELIKPIQERVLDENNELTSLNIEGYTTIDSKRIQVRYNEEGGVDKDGVIELRPGVPELSLGNAHYAQCRIAVDTNNDGVEDHYLKGMAVYMAHPEKVPEGVDIIVNSNKHIGTPEEKVFKKIKMKQAVDPETGKPVDTDEIDKENPFGASIKRSDELVTTQKYYIDPKTGEKKLSAINVVNEEGDWDRWSRTLSSQFLAKQTPQLAEKQLKLTLAEKQDEFDTLKSLTNATIKKEMLNEFADKCDAAAVHLKAAGLPGQSAHVILPLDTIKDTEIYAPGYPNGTRVALVRYPHAGRFEIPELTVNNNSRIAKQVIGAQGSDAVGITPKTAAMLSGADFDGDTVAVIPIRDERGNMISDVKTEKSIRNKEVLKEEIRNFEPKEAYPGYPGMKVMTEADKQKKMGEVSNLITDMTVQGAPLEDIVRVDKLSMVVIDAVKHELDYKRAYRELDIKGLKEKYQRQPDGTSGAATLISRAKSESRVALRKQWYASKSNIDPETGAKIQRENYKYSTWVDRETGELKERTTKSTKMYEVDDARKLMSGPNHEGQPIEHLYADYANALKKMGNDARLAYLAAEKEELPKNSSAAKAYADEVLSLNKKLLTAQKNQPMERQAQRMASVVVEARLQDAPNADKETRKKWKNQALAAARARYGAEKKPFTFTDREWEAIQAGAVGKTNLRKMMQYCDKDELKQRALPKATNKIPDSRIALIKSYAGSNFSLDEIARKFGISTSTVSRIMNGSYGT